MRFLFFCAFLILSAEAAAQQGRYRPFYTPALPPNTIADAMFSLPPQTINHRFTLSLPKDGLLIIEAARFRDFPDSTSLTDLIKVAADAVEGIRDSFVSPQSIQTVQVHIPVEGGPQTVRYFEHRDLNNLIVRGGNTQAPLKIGMDTVRILRTYTATEVKKRGQVLEQVQYTILLKSLDEIQNLAFSESLLADAAGTFDSVVGRKKQRLWLPNAWYTSYEAAYDPQLPADDAQRLRVQKVADENGNRGLNRGFIGTIALGAGLFRNTLVPTLDLGVGYKWPKKTPDQFRFLQLTYSSLLVFKSNLREQVSAQSALYLGVELGSIYNRPRTLLPLYRTSVGLAYLVGSDIPNLPAKTMRVSFTYSLNRYISLRPEVYMPVPFGSYTPDEADDIIVSPGLTLRVHL